MKYIEPSTMLSIHPKEWMDILNSTHTSVYQYRNLQHFKHHVKSLTQLNDTKCGVSYKNALKDLLRGTPQITESDYQTIKNTVRQNLLKRGLISESIYESYRYDIEGEIWDVSKVIAEDPACFLVANESYKNYFYELYISVSYPYHVSNDTVIQNMAKILATVELLEREHIYCKISLIVPNRKCNIGDGKPNYLGIIPIFSHRDTKTIETMSSVLNDRLLRKFFFAIWKDLYGKNLAGGYGVATELPYTIIPVDLDECDLASSIIDKVIIGGTR